MKPNKPAKSSGLSSNSGAPQDPVARQVEQYTARIATLFGELSSLADRRVETAGAHASNDEQRAAEISTEIRRLMKEMNQLRERTGHWHQKSGGPNDVRAQRRRDAEGEKLRLRQRLGRVADAQVALVAQWNADPSPDKRYAFEREYQRLAREYSEIRGQLQLVRQFLDAM